MASTKLYSLYSTINRALGMIEGVSYGMPMDSGNAINDAVQMIEESVKEIESCFLPKTVVEVDGKEVVFCKDCKFFNLFDLSCRYEYRNGTTKMSGFCHSGERKHK